MHVSRLFQIIYILMERETTTAVELAERFEVSTRTIYRDVEALSQARIPIIDEGKEHHGKIAIRNWSNNHFNANVTNNPIAIKQNQDEIIVTCKIDGDYDKTGLPDPLLLDFYFKINDGKIVKLYIK